MCNTVIKGSHEVQVFKCIGRFLFSYATIDDKSLGALTHILYVCNSFIVLFYNFEV